MNAHFTQRRSLKLLAAALLVGIFAWTSSAQTLPSLPATRAQPNRDDKITGFKENPRMLAAFHEVVASPSRSVVRIRCDNKDVALGTVVGADGWIITKNSELTAGFAPIVVTREGRTLLAKVVSVENHSDLAMLKVDAVNLVPVPW